MSESEFIEGDEYDLFDPDDIAKLEAAEQEVAADDGSGKVRALLDRRRLAYSRVFAPGERDKEDIDIVLADLMWFCRVTQPTYDVRDGEHAEVLSRIKEGRREVFHRIRDFSALSPDAIYLMYTNATTKQE